MWISRRAFDTLLAAHVREVDGLHDEVTYLRGMLATATDHNRRMARVDRSLGELEPRRKEQQPDEHMPPGVQRLVALYDTPSGREVIASSIRSARAERVSWPEIEQRLKADLPEALVRRLEQSNGA